MKTKLSEYIEIARNTELQKPLFSNEDIRNLTENKSKINSQIKLPTFKGKIIMNSIITLILGLSVAWYSGIMDNNQPKETQQKVLKKEVNNDNLITSIVGSKNDEEEIETKKEFKGLPLIKLTDEELKQLEIYMIEGGYKFTTESTIDNIRGSKKEMVKLHEVGYDTILSNGLYRDMGFITDRYQSVHLKYNGWHKTKPAKYYPIALDANNGGSVGFVRYSSSFSSPALIKNNSYKLFQDKSDYLKYLGKMKVLNYRDWEFLPINEDSFPATRLLVPLHLATDKLPNTILWYVPTKEFVDKLPERYKKIVSENYQIVDYLVTPDSPDKPDEKEQIKEKYLKKIKEKFLNIPTVDLNWDELANLGITKHDRTTEDSEFLKYKFESLFELKPEIMEMAYQMGIDTNYDFVLIKTFQMVSANKIGTYGNESDFEWSGDTSKYSKTVPCAVTVVNDLFEIDHWREGDGSSWMCHIPFFLKDKFSDDIIGLLGDAHQKVENDPNYVNSKEWMSVSSLLIPVHVNLGNRNETDGNIFSDIMFWFFPNEEFLNKLPKKYADRIRTELGIILDVQSGKTTFEEACKGFKNESLFNICQLKSGALSNLYVFPNPSKGKEININFLLTEKRNVIVSIHDLQGNLVQTISPKGQFNIGEVKVKTSGRELSQGLYQVVIYSDKDEMITTKLIVE